MSRLEQIEKMLAADPDDAFLNFALAMEYVNAERPEDAVNQFARVCEIDPNHVAAYSQRATLLVALDRKAEARSVLEAGLAAAGRAGDSHGADHIRESLSLLK